MYVGDWRFCFFFVSYISSVIKCRNFSVIPRFAAYIFFYKWDIYIYQIKRMTCSSVYMSFYEMCKFQNIWPFWSQPVDFICLCDFIIFRDIYACRFVFCICVYIYVCVCIHLYICIYIGLYACTYIHVLIFIHHSYAYVIIFSPS